MLDFNEKSVEEIICNPIYAGVAEYSQIISDEMWANAAEVAVKATFEQEAANEVFCVTDGRDYTMNELINSVCHVLDISWRPLHMPVLLADLAGKFGDVLRKWTHVPFPIDSDRVRKLSRPLTFSCEKAKRMLGYVPVETMEEGIRREVEWLKGRGERRQGRENKGR